MVEERVTTVESPGGQAAPVHTTTVVTDGGGRSGSPGWFVGIVILLALIAGIYFFTGLSGSETAKDNAIANAANQVGTAANKAGTAVERAGAAAEEAADNATQK